MKDYNGFPADFRDKVYKIQKTGGLLAPIQRQPCSMCGGKGGFMMCHTENYYNLLDLVPCCVECHMKLHARFSRPGVWIQHLIELSEGRVPKQWQNTNQYFAQQNTKRVGGFSPGDEYYPELVNEAPGLFGDKWYHQLLMKKIDLYSLGNKQLPRLADFVF